MVDMYINAMVDTAVHHNATVMVNTYYTHLYGNTHLDEDAHTSSPNTPEYDTVICMCVAGLVR